MRIGMLGSGVVGQVVGTGLTGLGHEVMIGTREPGQLGEQKGHGASLQAWLDGSGGRGRVGTFAEAAAFGELLVNATSGRASLEALHLAGAEALGDKVLLDLANELDFSTGTPRSLASPERSLAEDIQAAFPQVRVVKSLNTMNAALMVDPQSLAGGDHTVFVCGNDPQAREQVAGLLGSLGWSDILDLGDLTGARGVELLMPLWLRLWGVLGGVPFQFRVVR